MSSRNNAQAPVQNPGALSGTSQRLPLMAIGNLHVFMGERRVGTMATNRDGLVAFEYDAQWMSSGYSISPLSLPLEQRVFLPRSQPFEGVWGVFNDSLPDGWGRLLVDRMLRRKGVNPEQVTTLMRLAIVGSSGMGALSYQPELDLRQDSSTSDLDRLAAEAKKILTSNTAGDLDELFALGGSSGGARPKILTKIDGEDWIIKFSSSLDRSDVGLMEYQYALAAQACGIKMPEVRLLASKQHQGYFAVKRFDRILPVDGASDEAKKVHVVSVSGLLETTHRIPSLDYSDLLKLTLLLTNDYSQVRELYRLACFNIFAHNQDDHSKNFSFLFSEQNNGWQLAPAYDLTYAIGMGGEHATTVNGKGRDIGLDDLVDLAKGIGLSTREGRAIAVEVQDHVQPLLACWGG